MAELEMGPLSDRLSDEEIVELRKKMEKVGAPPIPSGEDDEASPIGEPIDNHVLTEFLDRLDGHDVAAEIYLPVEFDGVIEVAGLRVASLQVLVDILDEVKEELALEDEDDDEDEDDGDEDDNLLQGQLKELFKTFQDGAQLALERKLPLHVKHA